MDREEVGLRDLKSNVGKKALKNCNGPVRAVGGSPY